VLKKVIYKCAIFVLNGSPACFAWRRKRSSLYAVAHKVWRVAERKPTGSHGLSHFGRHLGQNKAKVSVFNGSVVYFNVGIGLTFLCRSYSTCQELYFHLF
jgi:hypothetical protein